MKLVLAYGLPGSGKSTLLESLYNAERINTCAELISFDEPSKRKLLKSFFSETLIEENKTLFVDFLLQDPNKLLQTLSNRRFNELEVIIHQFIPDVVACLINDKKRGRELDATPTIKNMKIKLLDQEEINYQYSELKVTIFTHNTYKEL